MGTVVKLPAIQFYPADWRKDPGVQSLTYHDRGVWFEILCLMHESEQRGKLLLNGKAMPEEALARLLGLDKQNLTNALTNILTYGVCSRDQETGALVCRRMVRDEELRKIRQNCGKQGGNPRLLNQKSNQTPNQNPTTPVNQIPTPSSSSSTSVNNSRFKKPTMEEVKLQGAKIGLPVQESEKFFNYYESNGWRVGKNPMKSWPSAMVNWRTHWQERNGKPPPDSSAGGKVSVFDSL